MNKRFHATKQLECQMTRVINAETASVHGHTHNERFKTVIYRSKIKMQMIGLISACDTTVHDKITAIHHTGQYLL